MSSKKNTTRKNRKKEDDNNVSEELVGIELKENDICMDPTLEKKWDLIEYAKFIEKKIQNLKPPDTYISLYAYTILEIDGMPVIISIGKEINKKTYQFQIIADSTPRIKSEDTDRNDRDISLQSGKEFKTVLSILEHIDDVKNNYKLIDSKLKSPNDTKYIKLQRKIYPIPTDKNCSVCYEPTTEYTVCKHPICFRCRHKCIMSNNLVCPICRDGELRIFPTELSYEDEYFVT